MKKQAGFLQSAGWLILRVLFPALILAGVSFSSGCEDDPIVQNAGPHPPPSSWWPGYPYADSVTYLDNDSIILHGHFKSQQLELSVVRYLFLVHEHGEGISNHTEFMIQHDVKWTFSNLEIPLKSEIKIPAIVAAPGVTTDFTLEIEVVNAKYKQGDPIGYRTYYLVSNRVRILPASE